MILKADQITKPRGLPRPANLAARAGLRYQKQVAVALAKSAPANIEILTDPWFSYLDTTDLTKHSQICSPDILAIDCENGFVIVFEVKTTYTPRALDKLKNLYCPVVYKAGTLPATPIVLCKNLYPGAPRPQPTISFALLSAEPLIHWIGQGPILW